MGIFNDRSKRALVGVMRECVCDTLMESATLTSKQATDKMNFVLENATYEQLLNITMNPDRDTNYLPAYVLEGAVALLHRACLTKRKNIGPNAITEAAKLIQKETGAVITESMKSAALNSVNKGNGLKIVGKLLEEAVLLREFDADGIRRFIDMYDTAASSSAPTGGAADNRIIQMLGGASDRALAKNKAGAIRDLAQQVQRHMGSGHVDMAKLTSALTTLGYRGKTLNNIVNAVQSGDHSVIGQILSHQNNVVQNLRNRATAAGLGSDMAIKFSNAANNLQQRLGINGSNIGKSIPKPPVPPASGGINPGIFGNVNRELGTRAKGMSPWAAAGLAAAGTLGGAWLWNRYKQNQQQ